MGIVRTISEHFDEGGWGMWLILAVCIFIVAIIIERAVYLIKSGVNKDMILDMLKQQINSGNVQGAMGACDNNPTPLTRIVKAGLAMFKHNRPDHDIQAAMDEAALRELPLINKRTPYLAMLANLATLAGLLGTIVGMIGSFAAAGKADPNQKAALLAKGISEAMNCTAFGIGSALLGLVGYAFLQGTTQGLTDDINEVTVQVVNMVVNHRQAMRQPGAAA